MSETDDELEAIRERKREELLEGSDGAGSAEKRSDGTPDEPIHVDGRAHLDELVGDHRVVLVDFYADWCGPCEILEPIVADVAAETDAAVAKVDIDAHQQLAGQYRVQGVPTLHLFVDGEPTEQMVGVQQKDALVDLVEQHA